MGGEDGGAREESQRPGWSRHVQKPANIKICLLWWVGGRKE